MLYDLDAGIAAVTTEIEELERRREAFVQAKAALEATGVAPIEPTPEDGATDGERRTRKETIVAFLDLMGPTKRSEIVDLNKIPAGTVSYELHDKETFIRLEDGRWDLRTNHPAEQPAEDEVPAASRELTEDDIPF